MRPCLIRNPATLYWYDNNHEKHEGPNPRLTGNSEYLLGDCTYLFGENWNLTGDCSGLSGNCTGIFGICTGISGNLDSANITLAERKKGIRINKLVIE